MRRIILLLILALCTLDHHGQIIADHTVVDLYDDIPANWIDSVKTMVLTIAGESHRAAYSMGLEF